jgi:AAA+ ATPase superfamily predicted ATPase
MSMLFIDRQRELQALDRFYSSPGAGLFILYGRRRVGKTRLLTYFLEQGQVANTFYWTATTHSSPYQLRDFSQALLEYDPRRSISHLAIGRRRSTIWESL